MMIMMKWPVVECGSSGGSYSACWYQLMSVDVLGERTLLYTQLFIVDQVLTSRCSMLMSRRCGWRFHRAGCAWRSMLGPWSLHWCWEIAYLTDAVLRGVIPKQQEMMMENRWIQNYSCCVYVSASMHYMTVSFLSDSGLMTVFNIRCAYVVTILSELSHWRRCCLCTDPLLAGGTPLSLQRSPDSIVGFKWSVCGTGWWEGMAVEGVEFGDDRRRGKR